MKRKLLFIGFCMLLFVIPVFSQHIAVHPPEPVMGMQAAADCGPGGANPGIGNPMPCLPIDLPIYSFLTIVLAMGIVLRKTRRQTVIS